MQFLFSSILNLYFQTFFKNAKNDFFVNSFYTGKMIKMIRLKVKRCLKLAVQIKLNLN